MASGMTAGSVSVTILDTYAWPTLAFASVNASCMSMTSPTAGSTMCALSRSCRSSHDAPLRSASAADVQPHSKTAAGPGRFWNYASTTHSALHIAQRLLELLKPIPVADDHCGDDDDEDGHEHDDDDDDVHDHDEELAHLLRWLRI